MALFELLHGVPRVGADLVLGVVVAHEADDEPVLVGQLDALDLGQLHGQGFVPFLGVDEIAFAVDRGTVGGSLAHADPAADWPLRCVSAYASSHPWEDWAETWANYLHMVDTLDTALSFGLEGGDVEIQIEPYGNDALDAPGDPGAPRFLGLVNAWLQITALMNELARSMGQPDLYPFVLSHHAVAKLHFVHRVVNATAAQAR